MDSRVRRHFDLRALEIMRGVIGAEGASKALEALAGAGLLVVETTDREAALSALYLAVDSDGHLSSCSRRGCSRACEAARRVLRKAGRL